MDVIQHGLVGKNAGALALGTHGSEKKVRLDLRGELFTEPVMHDYKVSAVEGTYYIARTPTPGTGITLTSATGNSYSATNGIFGVNNTDAVGGRDIILDYFKVILTAAGTASTSAYWVGALDSGARVSAGTTLTRVNANGLYGDSGIADIHAGVITIATATNQVRYLSSVVVRKAAAPAFIVDDVIAVKFGGAGMASDHPITATTAISVVLPMAPVVIPPQWSFVLLEWAPARTAAQSAEVEVGYIVR